MRERVGEGLRAGQPLRMPQRGREWPEDGSEEAEGEETRKAERPTYTGAIRPFGVVEITGLEPVTSGLQSRRSPN